MDEQKNEKTETKTNLRINGSIIFVGAILLVIITVFATFFVADKIYYNGALFRRSESVSFSGEDTDAYKVAKFQNILRFLEENYCLEYDINDVIEGAINGAVEALGDPYTRYLKPGELGEYVDYITGTYVGIGLTYQETESGMLVVSVETGAPADEGGITAGDIISHINGKAYSEYTETEMSELFAEEGNELTVKVISQNGITKDVTLKIQKVSRQTVFVTDYDGIMYVKITQFDEDTGEKFKTAIDKIEHVGCSAMIIDLRNNGGGYESQADIVADRILPEGLIAYAEDKNGNRITEIKSDAACIGVPLAVLVNGNTASASELVTGAIRDHKIGTIIGENTFGKALGQTRLDFTEDGSGILVTVARYFTPSGECIHGKGIAPDIEVTLPEEYVNVSLESIPFDEDTQLQKAIEILKG